MMFLSELSQDKRPGNLVHTLTTSSVRRLAQSPELVKALVGAADTPPTPGNPDSLIGSRRLEVGRGRSGVAHARGGV